MPAQPVTTEAQLESYFRMQVRRRLGGAVYKLAPTHVGMPDRMVLLPAGRIHLVELKTRTGRVRPAQQAWHDQARELGTVVDVLRGKEGIDVWVRKRQQDFR